MSSGSPTNLPQTVGKALDILEVFADSKHSLGITELSRKVALNKSTVYRIVQALKSRGYLIQKSSSKQYSLGYKILEFGRSFLNNIELRKIAKKYLVELSIESGYTVHLGILERKEVVYIDRVEGTDVFQLRYLQIGDRVPVHCTASGKCILAFLDDCELENVLNGLDLTPFTAETITSIEDLRKELTNIRSAGFACCNREHNMDLRSIGAPVLALGSKVIGAVLITASYNKIKLGEVAKYGRMVKETALKISTDTGAFLKANSIDY
jgi:DNA-binding IclR family transcriptional regulator